jgi:hypothetical protein
MKAHYLSSPVSPSDSFLSRKDKSPERFTEISRTSSRRLSTNSDDGRGITQARELIHQNEILLKENERKDRKIISLSKEIQNLRILHNNDEVSALLFSVFFLFSLCLEFFLLLNGVVSFLQ